MPSSYYASSVSRPNDSESTIMIKRIHEEQREELRQKRARQAPQGQLAIEYPLSQISRASRASRQSHVSRQQSYAASSQAGSYHSLRDIDPSDSCSQIGAPAAPSAVSTSSRASNVFCASTVWPGDSLSQVGGPAGSARTQNGRARDLSGRELALLNAQGGSHAPTIVSFAGSQAASYAGSQAFYAPSQAGSYAPSYAPSYANCQAPSQASRNQGPQLLPYTASTAGTNISTDSTLVVDMRNQNQNQSQNRRAPPPSNPCGQGNGGNGGNGGHGGGRRVDPSDPANIVVTEADIARGREMWPRLDRESIKSRMKVTLIREEVTRRMRR